MEEYQSLLHKKLLEGSFVYTAEATPPDASNKDVLLYKTLSFYVRTSTRLATREIKINLSLLLLLI